MTPAAMARMGFTEIRRNARGTTAVYDNHLYTFDADMRCISTAPISEIRITGLADIFEAMGDRWNARNDQHHTQADRKSNDVDGYDEPTGGPMPRIRKPEVEQLGQPLDQRLRRSAEATRRALASIKF